MNHSKILKSLRKQIKRNIDNGEDWNKEVKKLIKNHKDITSIWSKFAVWLLVDPADGVLQYVKNEGSRVAIGRVAELYANGGTEEEFRAAAHAALDAALAADGALAAALAAAAAAAYAALDALDAAADAASTADWAAETWDAAVWTGVITSWNADYATYTAGKADRKQSYEKQAAKLLELLKEGI